MHLIRNQLGLTYSDTRKLSIPKMLDIFEYYAEMQDDKKTKKTARKELTVNDLEGDW